MLNENLILAMLNGPHYYWQSCRGKAWSSISNHEYFKLYKIKNDKINFVFHNKVKFLPMKSKYNVIFAPHNIVSYVLGVMGLLTKFAFNFLLVWTLTKRWVSDSSRVTDIGYKLLKPKHVSTSKARTKEKSDESKIETNYINILTFIGPIHLSEVELSTSCLSLSSTQVSSIVYGLFSSKQLVFVQFPLGRMAFVSSKAMIENNVLKLNDNSFEIN